MSDKIAVEIPESGPETILQEIEQEFRDFSETIEENHE